MKYNFFLNCFLFLIYSIGSFSLQAQPIPYATASSSSSEDNLEATFSDEKWSFVVEILSLDPERRERHVRDAEPILTGKMSAFKAFLKGSEKAIAAYLKLDNEDRQLRRIKEGEEIVYEETLIIAEVLKDLLEDIHSVEFKKAGSDYFVMTKKGSYDLNKLLEFANFNQVIFSSSALNRYHDYIDMNIIKAKPYLPGSWGRPTDADFIKADPKGLCKKLVLAEKEAINIYTGSDYRDMNAFLRRDLESLGVYWEESAENINSRFKEVILHSAIAVSGLNKMPDYAPPPNPDGSIPQYLFRGESSTPEQVLDIRKSAVEAGGEVTLEGGFLSTSYGKPVFFGEYSNCGIMFKNLKGKDITPLSMFGKGESEVLIPPTHLQWRYYKEVISDNLKRKIPLFLVKPVTAPHGTIPRASPLMQDNKVLVDL